MTGLVQSKPTQASTTRNIRHALEDIHGQRQRREKIGTNITIKKYTVSLISPGSGAPTGGRAKFDQAAFIQGLLDNEEELTLSAPDGYFAAPGFQSVQIAAQNSSVEETGDSSSGKIVLTFDALLMGSLIRDSGTYAPTQPWRNDFIQNDFITPTDAGVPNQISPVDSISGRNFTVVGSLGSTSDPQTKYAFGYTGFSASNYLNNTDTTFGLLGDLSLTIAFQLTSLPTAGNFATLLFIGPTSSAATTNLGIWVDSAGHLTVGSGTATTNTFQTPALTVGAHTLTLKRTGSTGAFTVKLDGGVNNNQTGTNQPAATSSSYLLSVGFDPGNYIGATNHFLTGNIFELRLWNSLISQSILDSVANPLDNTYKNIAVGTEYALWFFDSVPSIAPPLLGQPPQQIGYPLGVNASTLTQTIVPIQWQLTAAGDGTTSTMNLYNTSGYWFSEPYATGTGGPGQFTFSPSGPPTASLTTLNGISSQAIATFGVGSS